MTLPEAWATREEVQAQLSRLVTTGLPARSAAARSVHTVADLLTRWVEVQRTRVAAREIAPRTLVIYERDAEAWVGAIGEVLAHSLTERHAEQALRQWRADGVAARTCVRLVAVLRAATRWGADRGHCASPRLRALRGETEHVYCHYTPTMAEVWRVVDRVQSEDCRDLLVALVGTGARVGELITARGEDWDPARSAIRLHGRDLELGRRGKTGERWVPVSGRAAAVFAARAARSATGHMWPRMLPVYVNKAIERACARLGIERFTCHGIRRLAVMSLLGAGADPASAAKITGHSVQVMLTSYVRPTEASLRDLVHRAGLGQRPGQVIELSAVRSQVGGHISGARPIAEEDGGEP
ncbi:MAG TPA: site-specific integrase [Baekduia sp.]|nr:site-specific integrase [Baekduia sp.]